MKHGAGLRHLLQLRGPAAHEIDWELSILLSFRPIFVMNAMFTCQDCFLKEPRWQSVTKYNGAAARTIANVIFDKEGGHLIDEYFQLLTKIPSILCHGYALREVNNHGIQADIGKLLHLIKAAKELCSNFEGWYSKVELVNPGQQKSPRKTLSPYTYPSYNTKHREWALCPWITGRS
ncbi:uncharacterized protein BCR38DRAFT_99929 [Pseudomassariella vexata]|uniref:Uncharacterized protein n=1 Tax=Pseudomassariella vexata TaxID=1141098 RepID=A0A1Y2EEV9_9PEZI|nr:uncharacterized protein BCR38DRAFT_99929 [Pseudomassariella vexata]ORY70112.1 hypothetical protein BCR38DRAFT_99929 [Pseudomassariella vexata]